MIQYLILLNLSIQWSCFLDLHGVCVFACAFCNISAVNVVNWPCHSATTVWPRCCRVCQVKVLNWVLLSRGIPSAPLNSSAMSSKVRPFVSGRRIQVKTKAIRATVMKRRYTYSLQIFCLWQRQNKDPSLSGICEVDTTEKMRKSDPKFVAYWHHMKQC